MVEVSQSLPPYHNGCLQNFAKEIKKILHLWKIPVISLVRTNFAENAWEIAVTREPREKTSFFQDQGRRGGESESLEEEYIEIGNS